MVMDGKRCALFKNLVEKERKAELIHDLLYDLDRIDNYLKGNEEFKTDTVALACINIHEVFRAKLLEKFDELIKEEEKDNGKH